MGQTKFVFWRFILRLRFCQFGPVREVPKGFFRGTHGEGFGRKLCGSLQHQRKCNDRRREMFQGAVDSEGASKCPEDYLLPRPSTTRRKSLQLAPKNASCENMCRTLPFPLSMASREELGIPSAASLPRSG